MNHRKWLIGAAVAAAVLAVPAVLAQNRQGAEQGKLDEHRAQENREQTEAEKKAQRRAKAAAEAKAGEHRNKLPEREDEEEPVR